jgi:MFS family permease
LRQDTLETTKFARIHENGIWSSRYRALTIGIILTVVGSAFEALAVATTMPVTVQELGGLALYGWVFSAFMLTNLIGITVAGGEADRYGPARPFIFGVILFMIGLIISGLAPSMPILIAGRAVQGFGGGVLGSVVYVVVARGYPEEAKPRMLAVLSSAWVVPGLVGPAIAGFVAEHIGWRWVFLGLAPLTPLAALLALPAIRQLNQSVNISRNWRRIGAAAQLAIGVGLALAGPALGSLAITVLFVALGVVVAAPALRRLLPEGTLRLRPGLPAAIVAAGLANLSFFGTDSFIPLMLTALRGLSPALAGLVLTAATITWTTGSWLQAHYAAHQSRRRMVTIGFMIMAVGIASVMALLLPVVPALLGPVLWGVAGLGMGLAYATISLTVLETAPKGQEGTATSAMQLTNMLGTALGAGIGGAIVGSTEHNSQPSAGHMLAQFALMVVVALFGVFVARRLPGNE